MSRLVICAFESPAAAAQRRHYSPREICQMPASTRRTPAHEAPSVGDGEAPASLPQQCMCGQTHEGAYSATWNTGENIRLVETLIDSSVRDAFTVICEGRTRDAMDASTPDPWLSIAKLYNSLSFKPDNRFATSHSHLDIFDPGDPTKHHTRDAKKLKTKWG